MSEPISDGALDGAAPPAVPSGYGEAALLLVESLIHGLVARSRLSMGEAVEIVQIALDAQIGISDERGDPEPMRPAVRHLRAIAASLSIDCLAQGAAADRAGDGAGAVP